MTELGYDIELIPKSNVEGVYTPDIKIGRRKWEMKSPKGKGGSLMKNTIQKALKQSCYIIIDLKTTKRHQTKCLCELKRQFDYSKNIRQIMVITKGGRILNLRSE